MNVRPCSRMATLKISRRKQRYEYLTHRAKHLPHINLIKAQIIDFSKEDDENPRNWPRRRKFINVAIIAFMSGK